MTTPDKKPIGPDDLKRLARALGLYVLKDKLNPEELASGLPSLELLAYPEGTDIVLEGNRETDLYVLSKGFATVFREGRQVARLAAGDIFGEVAFTEGPPKTRSATVRAGEGCEAFRCQAVGFTDLVSKHPALLKSIKGIAQTRLKKPV